MILILFLGKSRFSRGWKELDRIMRYLSAFENFEMFSKERRTANILKLIPRPKEERSLYIIWTFTFIASKSFFNYDGRCRNETRSKKNKYPSHIDLELKINGFVSRTGLLVSDDNLIRNWPTNGHSSVEMKYSIFCQTVWIMHTWQIDIIKNWRMTNRVTNLSVIPMIVLYIFMYFGCFYMNMWKKIIIFCLADRDFNKFIFDLNMF